MCSTGKSLTGSGLCFHSYRWLRCFRSVGLLSRFGSTSDRDCGLVQEHRLPSTEKFVNRAEDRGQLETIYVRFRSTRFSAMRRVFLRSWKHDDHVPQSILILILFLLTL